MWNQLEPIILASSSPRRRELLHEANIKFEVMSPTVDESILDGENPMSMVLRLSVEKGDEVAKKFPSRFILAADTTVVLDGEIIGKPESPVDALKTLLKMQGREHEVVGGISIINKSKNILWSEAFSSLVTMKSLSKETLERYVATKEPLDKAGSYAIQGIGAQFITSIKGSYSNVVGLNVAAVIEKLKDFQVIN